MLHATLILLEDREESHLRPLVFEESRTLGGIFNTRTGLCGVSRWKENPVSDGRLPFEGC